VEASKIVAWWATLVCVIYSARLATTFLKHNSRLFSALALLACGWALLLPYYSTNVPSELYAAYGGFLLVYIGGLLALEANEKKGVTHDHSVVVLQQAALALLLVIAAPSGFALRGPDNQTVFGLTILQSEILVATLLDITGYVSAAYGLYRLSSHRLGAAFAALAVAYSLLEIAYTVRYWPPSNGAEVEAMSASFRYALAAAKVLFTGAFASSVAYQGMKPDVRNAGLGDWVLRFINLHPAS
jgi:hypothetical protein